MANSYKDPYWSNLSANTEKLLKLPTGLLQNIVMHGEKSNADQVSSAGAKTVFQITPTTRNLILKKYGLDSYSSDKNAAMGAGLLLRESLQRNKGDVESAIGEYHGGTDRSNWGSVNKAYRGRVMAAQNGSQPQQQQSTYDRIIAQQKANEPQSIANIYKAYKNGKMNKRQQEAFEHDVKTGHIMLPDGADLIDNKPNKDPILLPQSVSDAYVSGKMNSRQRDALEHDIKIGAVKLPLATKNQSALPDFDQSDVAIQQPTEQAIISPTPDRSLTDSLKGLGEAGLTTLTGATTGALGMIGGTATQAAREIAGGNFGTPEAANRIAQNAAESAGDLTYAPRTQAGQDYVQTIADVTEPLAALTPATAEIGLAAQAARGALPQATVAAQRAGQAIAPVVERTTQAVQRPIQATSNAIQSGVENLKSAVGLTKTPDPDAAANMGAMQTSSDTQRLALFDDLNVTPTTAQVSRNQGDLAEMHNMARAGGESGKVISEGLERQQRELAATIDDMIERTGAQSTNFYATGGKINDALNTQFKVEKAKVNKQYQQARESEGAKTKVDLTQNPKWSESELSKADETGNQLDTGNVFSLINDNLDLEGTPVYRDMKRSAVKLGIADEDANGQLIPKPKGQEPTVNMVEDWRQRIGQIGNDANSIDVRAKPRIKKLIDNSLDNSGSNAFKQARKEYGDFKNAWTNRAIVKDLIEMKKGANNGDRKVIDEKIVDRITSTATSQEDLDFIKKMITKSPDGQQAWKDLQGTVINHIRNKAFSGADDASGNPALLASKMNDVIEKLDGHTRRLDTLLDKEDADRIRDAGMLARILKTVPENTGVNWSNTINAGLTGLFDLIFVIGAGGLPLPVATLLRQGIKHVKDKKQVARANIIINSLEKSKRQQSTVF